MTCENSRVEDGANKCWMRIMRCRERSGVITSTRRRVVALLVRHLREFIESGRQGRTPGHAVTRNVPDPCPGIRTCQSLLGGGHYICSAAQRGRGFGNESFLQAFDRMDIFLRFFPGASRGRMRHMPGAPILNLNLFADRILFLVPYTVLLPSSGVQLSHTLVRAPLRLSREHCIDR